MRAKDFIKRASLYPLLSFVSGATGPVLRHAGNENMEPGELLARTLGAGTAGVGGAYGGRELGRMGASRMFSAANRLVAKGKGKTGTAARLLSRALPYIGDIAGVGVAGSLGSLIGSRMYRGAKKIRQNRKMKQEGLLERVSLPAAAALEAAKESV